MTGRLYLYERTLAARQDLYNTAIANGTAVPFIYPWDSFPALWLFLGVFLSPKLPRAAYRPFRWLCLTTEIVHSVSILRRVRTIGFAAGYGIGLTCSWALIMSVVLLVIHEPEKSFIRLEVAGPADDTNTASKPIVNGSTNQTERSPATHSLRKRAASVNMHADFEHDSSPKSKPMTRVYEDLRWQQFPSGIIHGFDWTIDLMTSFRGPNWNYRLPNMTKIETPPIPQPFPNMSRTIVPTTSMDKTNSGKFVTTFPTINPIIRTIIYYLLLDTLKTIMITDPYFLSIADITSPAPPSYSNLLETISSTTTIPISFLTKFTRLLIALSGVIIPLQFIFSFNPSVFFSLLPHIISPATLYNNLTKAPLYNPSMYDNQFQSQPSSTVLTTLSSKGLAGFWGSTWHQMFRFGISEPSKPIITFLGLDPRKSQLARIIQLLVAFTLTGFIHALSSYTVFSIRPSKPLHPLSFFVLQGVGIIIQTSVSKIISAPKIIRQISNVGFVLVWLYFTGPILANDFARCGVWLFEPLPISFVRGALGEGWWKWGGFGDWMIFGFDRSRKGRLWEMGIAAI